MNTFISTSTHRKDQLHIILVRPACDSYYRGFKES